MISIDWRSFLFLLFLLIYYNELRGKDSEDDGKYQLKETNYVALPTATSFRQAAKPAALGLAKEAAGQAAYLKTPEERMRERKDRERKTERGSKKDDDGKRRERDRGNTMKLYSKF